MVDYEPSPDQKGGNELPSSALSDTEQRAKLREVLGSSDEEEPGEIQRERSKDHSPPRARERSPSRPRSRSRSKSRPRTISREEYRSLNRDRTQSHARVRSRSPSGDRFGQWWPGDYGRRLPDITNSQDDDEELMAAVHHRTNRWPWMVYWEKTKQWRGQKYPPQRHIHRLYDCTILRNHAKDRRNAIRREADAMASDKEFLSLFLEHRFLKAKKARHDPSLESACQAWNMFISNYIADPEHWRKRLQDARTDHTHTLPGMRLEIHRLCDEYQLPCMVVQEPCETCGPNGPKMPDEVFSTSGGPVSIARLKDRVPTILWNLYEKYELALARWQATSDVFDHNRTRGQAHPRGGRDVVPTSRGRADSPSSEQDMFAADPFALDHGGQGASQLSTSSRHSRRGAVAEVEGRSTRESRVAMVSAGGYSRDRWARPLTSRDQEADHEKRISMLERTVEGLLDLDLRLTESQRDYKRLLGELQRAGVHLQRFDRNKVEDDLRKT
jgi:hypothetical protein